MDRAPDRLSDVALRAYTLLLGAVAGNCDEDGLENVYGSFVLHSRSVCKRATVFGSSILGRFVAARWAAAQKTTTNRHYDASESATFNVLR